MTHERYFGLFVISSMLTMVTLPCAMPASAANGADQLNVVIAIDCSGSMKEDGRYEMVAAGVAAALAALPDGATVSIILFNDESRLLVDAEELSDHSRLRWSLAIQAEPKGGTDIVGCVREALGHVADGGLILVLSDGRQTGSGSTTVPRSAWEPLSQTLTSEANQRGILVHSIGLSDGADKELLGFLSQETGGEFFAVSRPKDLVDKYIEIVSIIGKFWRRRDPGEFDVIATEDIVTICSESEQQHGPVSRVSQLGAATPVVPSFSIHRAGITARRYKLQPGRYRFVPNAAGSSDLLRPMHLAWVVPGTLAIHANRVNEFTILAKSMPDTLEGLSLFWRGSDSETVAINDKADKGRFVLSLSGSRTIGQSVSGELVARQSGFEYRVGLLSGKTVEPPPHNFAVKLLPAALAPVVWGTARQFEFQLNVESPPSVRKGEIRLTSADVNVQVDPATIQIADSRISTNVLLSLKENVTESVSTRLEIVAVADDVVESSINGMTSLTKTIDWTIADPRLTLTGLNEQTVSGDRGGNVAIPVQLGCNDIDGLGFVPSVRIVPENLPGGIRFSLIDSADEGPTVDRLVAGRQTHYSLVLHIDESVAPGQYPVELAAIASHPRIPVNNSTTGFPIRLTLVVNAESVRLSLDPGVSFWLVRPTTVEKSHRFSVTAVTDSGRSIPTFDLSLRTDPFVRIDEINRTMPTPDKVIILCEMIITPIGWPFRSEVGVAVCGSQVHALTRPVIRIVGEPIRVTLRPRTETLQVIAPVTRQRCEVWLDIASNDHSQLPPLEVHAFTDLPVEITEEERLENTIAGQSIRYSVSIPEQSLPFTGTAQFSVSGEGIACDQPATIKIDIPEIQIGIAKVRAEMIRFPAWYEALMGFFCTPPRVRVSLDSDQNLWKKAGVQWAVVTKGQSASKNLCWHASPIEDAYHTQDMCGEILLAAQYCGTRFTPSSRLPISVEHIDAPVPWWFWSAITGLSISILTAIFGRRITRPVVPGCIEISQLSEPSALGRIISLGKPRHGIALGHQEFSIRALGGRVLLSWTGNALSANEKCGSPPRLLTSDGHQCVLEQDVWVEFFGSDEIHTTSHVANYVASRHRPPEIASIYESVVF